jgi:hypothetical protein
MPQRPDHGKKLLTVSIATDSFKNLKANAGFMGISMGELVEKAVRYYLRLPAKDGESQKGGEHEKR